MVYIWVKSCLFVSDWNSQRKYKFDSRTSFWRRGPPSSDSDPEVQQPVERNDQLTDRTDDDTMETSDSSCSSMPSVPQSNALHNVQSEVCHPVIASNSLLFTFHSNHDLRT
jgi:hypothetical protein